MKLHQLIEALQKAESVYGPDISVMMNYDSAAAYDDIRSVFTNHTWWGGDFVNLCCTTVESTCREIPTKDIFIDNVEPCKGDESDDSI